jgi:predicted ATPase
LIHFFEHGRWGSTLETSLEGQSLTAEDQLLILTQAGLYLTATGGMGAPETRICYERAESLCRFLNSPHLLYSALTGLWRYSLMTDKLTATLKIADQIYSLAQEQNNPELMIGAYQSLVSTLYHMGDFDSARKYAIRAVEIWRSGDGHSVLEDLDAPAVNCLCYVALTQWHLGEVASSKATMTEAISLAETLNDIFSLVFALNQAWFLGQVEGNLAEVERCASDVIELSARHNLSTVLPGAFILRGWARSVSGHTAEGIAWIEEGIRDSYRAGGANVGMPYFLALKAEALHLADRTSEALEAIKEAETLAERFEPRWWSAELYRLRGVFLTAIGAKETQIEASFCDAISIAKEQKSVSLEKRAEGTYAEYRRQKASALGGRGFQLPLC